MTKPDTPTPAASGAVPLTDEQITRLAKFHCGGVNTTWSFFDGGLIEFARAIAALASPQVAPAPEPEGFALVPLRLTREMERIVNEEDWQWSDLLAAAETVDEDAENWYTKADEAIEGMKIHGFAWDGAEWRENAPEAATPVQVAPTATPPAEEPVAQWQYRYASRFTARDHWSDWANTCKEVAEQKAKNQDRNVKYEVRALYAAPVAPQDDARDAADARRMNWLETMAVNVRVPLRCGSRDLFWSIADDEDGFVRPGDIRSKIDAAMRRSGPAAKPTEEPGS